MKTSFPKLTKEMRLNPGISDAKLLDVTSSLTHPLPIDFLSFLEFSNGANGMVGKHYLNIVKAEELQNFNEVLFVNIDAPGLFIFGSDGGGEVFGFDYRGKEPIVVMVPTIGMEWDQAIVKGKNFSDFLERLYDGHE